MGQLIRFYILTLHKGLLNQCRWKNRIRLMLRDQCRWNYWLWLTSNLVQDDLNVFVFICGLCLILRLNLMPNRLLPAWPVKSGQISIKVAQNDFTRKFKKIDTFTKITWECGRFGQNNCCQRLWNFAQSPINRPIWSHWLLLTIKFIGYLRKSSFFQLDNYTAF